MSLFPICFLDIIKYVDQIFKLFIFHCWQRLFTKTNPVLKAKLAGGFNGMLLKAWTSCCHDVMVMFSWYFDLFHEMSCKHDHDVMTAWCSNLFRHSIKTVCKFPFQNYFCFYKSIYHKLNMDQYLFLPTRVIKSRKHP